MSTTDKIILDPCCGSRMMWFDKNNQQVVFGDIRAEEHVLCDGRTLVIAPDEQIDFRQMPYADGTFRLVTFDPPHLHKLGKASWTAKKYGVLLPTWQQDIKLGFKECMRVLADYGILVFKWNEHEIKLKDVLAAIGAKPLFGHTSGRHGKTIWMTFMKMPKP